LSPVDPLVGMSSLLDEGTTWAEFGKRHLDNRVAKAITEALDLERPTLVQSQGIPVALEGKDLLCRARTGSGKTLCFAVPLVQRLLVETEAKGSSTPLSALILVPTKELLVQIHGVVQKLLSFCFDVLSAEMLMSGQKYTKAELPTILVTTPSSLLSLCQERRRTMRPLKETLKILVIDEADVMFSFGYEEDMRALCMLLPSTYQAVMTSATLSEEVEQLKGLMLHKPVLLKLEEPRVTGKLSQFYYVCHKMDKYLILYTLLKLQLVQGKTLIFVDSIQDAYRLKILFERFSMNSAVLNADLPHASRQNIIQSFNQSLVELLIATDDSLMNSAAKDSDDEEEDAPADDDDKGSDEDEVDPDVAAFLAEDDAAAEAAEPPKKKAKKKLKRKKGKKAKEEDEEDEEDDEEDAEATQDAEDIATIKDEVNRQAKEARAAAEKEAARNSKRGKRKKKGGVETDEAYSLTRGVDLVNVSTVINASVPHKVRSYVHRVGRCARGGSSGTALTICAREEEPLLERIIRMQAAAGGMSEMKALPLQIQDAERFRYRVEDMAKGLTKRVVEVYRARELQMEALHSEKLKEYFQENPEEKVALQRMQRTIREKKSIRGHLAQIPSYLVPEQLFSSNTPVQQAIREDASVSGKVSNATKKKRAAQMKKQDPLQGFQAGSGKQQSNKRRYSREFAIAKSARMDPTTTNPEELPPLSRRNVWKINHGKYVRKASDMTGERRRLTMGQKRRRKIFPM